MHVNSQSGTNVFQKKTFLLKNKKIQTFIIIIIIVVII